MHKESKQQSHAINDDESGQVIVDSRSHAKRDDAAPHVVGGLKQRRSSKKRNSPSTITTDTTIDSNYDTDNDSDYRRSRTDAAGVWCY